MKSLNNNLQHIRLWLWSVFLGTLFMIGLGGATRLTHAGLSIVEWKPLTGILPPLNETEWKQAFDEYKKFPEYQKVNHYISLKEFKFIYVMEYAHRLWGRMLGLLIIIPLLFFLTQKNLPSWLKKRGLSMAILLILQGVMGWYMVKSGLIDQPHVSHFRLAAHLSLALILLAVIMATVHDLKEDVYYEYSVLPLIMTCLSIIYGAFTAGLKAGLIYNEFPTMGGRWFPFEAFFHTPLWINFFYNDVMVQFLHRSFALVTMLVFWIAAYQYKKNQGYFLACLATFQVILGILTLLWQVPVSLGTLHQLVGTILFVLTFYHTYPTLRFSRTSKWLVKLH